MKFLGIIPARYASTRFPAKPLAILGGKTVIQRVYEQVAGILDDAYVATDDERIEKAVKAFGGKVVMTSVHHKSGTDRCYEACVKIGGDFDVVVNIQGDEPFIQPSQLNAVKACFEDPTTQIATLVKPFTADEPFAVLENVNSPKVVVNANWNALYFSRSIIPYQRNAENADDVHYVFDSCEQFSIPAAAKNPELAKEFLRFLYSDESVSAFAEASGALYATKSAREVAKDKLSTAIYNMYGIYEEANASSLIMSFAAVPADCKVNPKDEIFNPITSVMNDEMTVEEWAQNVEDAFAQVRADMEAAN